MNRYLTLGGVATVALALAGNMTIDPPSLASASKHAPSEYSDTAVVALLVSGSGPIAGSHPNVSKALGFTPGGAEVPRIVLDELTHKLEGAIHGFHQKVTIAVTSGDPYLVESGLHEMKVGLETVGTVISPGTANGDCAVNPIVVVDTLLAVAQAAAYNTAALWQNNIFWLASAGESKFGIEDQSATIAANL